MDWDWYRYGYAIAASTAATCADYDVATLAFALTLAAGLDLSNGSMGQDLRHDEYDRKCEGNDSCDVFQFEILHFGLVPIVSSKANGILSLTPLLI